MRHHTIIGRIGSTDIAGVQPTRADTLSTEIQFVDLLGHLGYGLGLVFEQLGEMGLRPSETAADLALFAATVTAADTRISRDIDSQDGWTREIELNLPVQDPDLWTDLAPTIVPLLNFLTGDRWDVTFRPRPAGLTLVGDPGRLRMANPSSVCLFSGGLDSFIGAVDLFASGDTPMLVSHYWDGITSSYQTRCVDMLAKRFPDTPLHHIRARVGFPTETIEGATVEDTLRARSFLFFALAAVAADAIGGDVTVYVPENGLISLNVPLDPLRIGALSTRTTHPYYMARFGDLLHGLGLRARLENRYAFKTKGQMARECGDRDFLRGAIASTMSCSSPGSRRFDPDPEHRDPKHCGRCVPCLIRRAAVREAYGDDNTPYRIEDLHARVLDTNKAEGEHIRSFQFAISRLGRNPGRARLDIHKPGPLIDHPDRLHDYEAVYVAGMQEVGRLLEGVRAEPL